MYAFAVGPVLRLAYIWSAEWDSMAPVGGGPHGRDEQEREQESDRTTIRLWDIASGRQRLEVDAREEGMPGSAFSLDGKLLASPGCKNRTIRILGGRVCT